ncbi:MAG: cob(I)yrinic acid a,c-diamide adenosyltransferase [Reichenbachiella sp.]|uniref:cob(I)yrinic acid a,c-diamide adenosyltransferase n=1 Tax=Reichenbachiella sp. TaxID=2184521 RepID=UPI0032974720
MKVYTKTGDKGTTGLLGGTRVSKANLRIESYGTIDELNSHIGMVRDQPVNESIAEELIAIQNTLFVIGSHLASDPNKSKVVIPEIEAEKIVLLENAIDRMDGELPEMRNFVLPGGHVSVSAGHIARCVCRRAERLVIGLSENEMVHENITKYLNRLSDYLFVLCRWMTQELKAPEVPWKP